VRNDTKRSIGFSPWVTNVWDVDDPTVKKKIGLFAGTPDAVTWSGSAERDIASTARASRLGILEAIVDHLQCGYVVQGEHMRNGDLAFILRCFLGSRRFYVKLKFVEIDGTERMHVFSAHLDR
jgi:hypothetical protein